MDSTYDVAVLGGGAAGLNAALVLARARRRVLVLDDGQPRNGPAAHMHGFLSRDGTRPAELLGLGRDEVRRYGGELADEQVTSVRRADEGFAVQLRPGRTVHARRVLIASGLRDELPDVPGLRDRWGQDVLHCPYCHGWEVRDRRIAVLATGPFAVHQALMFHQWSKDVTVVLHGAESPSAAQTEELAALGIGIQSGPATGLQIESERLTGIRLAGERVVPADAIAVFPRVQARIDPVRELGLTVVDDDLGEYLSADENGSTGVPGVWAAGNVVDVRAQVIVAAAAGMKAAAAINSDLIAEDLKRAVERHRATKPAELAPE